MQNITCPNPDCNVAETGKCVEGFEIGECPHQKKASAVSELPESDTSNEQTLAKDIDTEPHIFDGEILDIEKATDVLCSGPAIVICLVGPMDSGKTTLSVSLYDAFQNGPYENWCFGGSLTLTAFEKRWHYARAVCGKIIPDTPRTYISDGLGFLHIAVHSEHTELLNFLISDRSGEFYDRIADNLEECSELFEVGRADCILFLVDGNKLLSDERFGVKTDLLLLLQTLLENELFSSSQRLGIVLTKYDLVLSSDDHESAIEFYKSIVDEFKNRCLSLNTNIKSFYIAARPESNKTEIRYGVNDLINYCAEKDTKQSIEISIKKDLYNRAFHTLHLKL